MPVRLPAISELRDISESFGFDLTDQDLEEFQKMLVPYLASYEVVERMAPPQLLPVKYPRTSGYRPGAEENPHNAWYWKSTVAGAPDGPLAGKTVALKDNICLAGVPMMNGSMTLEGYVPEIDATVVTRILDAGGTILGKAVCEDLCFCGGSHSPATGPVLNPWDVTRSTGGSSSGSAALVAAGEVDLAMGGDQGGSIRIPSCWAGVVGHKPTHGLVPYTGIFPIEMTLDTTGPIGRRVADVAVLLEALAGPDGLDPRIPPNATAERYTEALTPNLDGVRIGVVQEGFGWPGLSESEVDEAVRDAARRLEKTGAHVADVSIPLHRNAMDVWTPIGVEGSTEFMLKGNAAGTNWRGFYNVSLIDAFAKGMKTRARNLAPTVQMVALLGEYMHRQYDGRYYAKAANLSYAVRGAYDEALEEFDVLVMPTLPLRPTKIPAPTVSREEYVTRALEMLINTGAFSLTGHPATTVPCQPKGSLPIGLMIIGPRYGDAKTLQVAAAFEDLAGGFDFPSQGS